MYHALSERAITAARGNTGLRDLLFRAVLADKQAAEAAIAAVEGHFADGMLPREEKLRETLETLAVGKLIAPLTPPERKLLRAATQFELPLPLPIWRRMAEIAGLGAPDRLLAFGLWESVPDIVDAHAEAATINAIAAAWRWGSDDGTVPEQIAAPILGNSCRPGAERTARNDPMPPISS